MGDSIYPKRDPLCRKLLVFESRNSLQQSFLPNATVAMQLRDYHGMVQCKSNVYNNLLILCGDSSTPQAKRDPTGCQHLNFQQARLQQAGEGQFIDLPSLAWVE